MGLLGGLFLLVWPLVWLHSPAAAGHSVLACHQQLEFRCSDGSCISNQLVCDGGTDCLDGSDERQCGNARCEKDEYSCRNKRCIPTRSACNGVDDCGDGSDEAEGHCGARIKCAASEFQCGDGQCVRHTWRCDHSPDCADGSDEVNCDQDECRVDNGGCSHLCLDQPMGFLCSCPAHMKLVDDTQCEEVDTCLESDVCDQVCVHANGSLTCECHEGYRMDSRSRECKVKGAEPQLVFTTSKGIWMKNLAGSELREVVAHVPGPGPLGALAASRTLFWAPRGQGLIYRISLDEEPQETVLVLSTRGSVSSLAVDWINRLLYWSSAKMGSVSAALLDGSAHCQLLSGLERPCAVVVDPLRQLLFWAQCGSSPRIERAGLDGRGRVPLVSSSIHQPAALSLDLPRQLLYWFDQKTRSISRVDLKGRHRKTVVESNGYLDRVFGLAVFEGFVYWSDEVTGSICRADKHRGRNLTVQLPDESSPGSVVVLHPALQPHGTSFCRRLGAECESECVTDLLQFSCVAPDKVQNKSKEIPTITCKVPATSLSDPTMPGVLSLIVFLSVLLVGVAVCWWRDELRPPRSLTLLRFPLKESQDPLITQGPHEGPESD